MKVIKTLYLLRLILLVLISGNLSAQSSRKLIHSGNKLYEEKKYGEAEKNYRKSLETKENTFIGNYNLGNTLYQSGKTEEAKQQYETAAADKKANPEQLARTYHNLGNTQMKN